jgi:hypothetical protein
MSGRPELLPEAKTGLGDKQSFVSVESQARSVLRERGMSEAEIDAQLNLAKREVWDLPRPDCADKGDSGE